MKLTDSEIQEITARVVEEFRKDSVMIEQLRNTNVLAGTDLIELDKGRNVSLEDLRKFIRGFGIYLEIIGKDDKEAIPTDNNVFSALRTLLEITRNNENLKNIFLRKDQEDQTNFLVRFGDFLDSMMSGYGTGIFPNGRIQTDRIEVRHSMTVMDLIINEIQAMAGEFSFSDCGKIEKVENLGDKTYKLWMEKKLNTDVTNFEVDDVLLSIINNLRIGGTDYRTSWFRPVTKNISENSLTVVLYPDSQVPGGKNFPPQEGYNVTRRGNDVLPAEGETNERAQSWMLSSREGRIIFLQNVFKPILEDYNYAMSIGKLPDVGAIRKLRLKDQIGVYAETIVAKNFYYGDWNGDLVCKKVDRGEWSLTVAKSDKPYRFVETEIDAGSTDKASQLEQHTVYHFGCKWGCIVDKTIKEPKWNSTDWVMLEGDNRYHLTFESSRGGQFHISDVDTVLTAKVAYGNRDITNVLMATEGVQSEWLRDTGNASADLSWKPRFVDGQKNVIHIKLDDMGSGWGQEYRLVTFIYRLFIPIGDKFETVEERLNVKL